jgi:NAD(P)-dependent dehydrogenase (short-subunit alcohol dehydrogenase family)
VTIRQTARSVVVFGADGMGLATARRVAGGRQLVLAARDHTQLEAAVGALRAEGHSVEGYAVDVTDRTAVERVAAAAAAYGQVDAVIYAETVSPVTSTARQIYEVDLLGAAHAIDAFFAVATPGMSLVCISSMAGHAASLSAELERHLATAPPDALLRHPEIDLDAPEGALAYVIAKRGSQLRVQAATHSWGSKGARLNTLSPGVTSTPVGRAELDGPLGPYIRSMVDYSGARRVGTPQDIAAVAAFLLSPEAAYVTGTDVLVDGGALSAQRWKPGS